MSRAQLVLTSRAIREQAINWINRAPANTRVEFKYARRTLEQNDKLWAMLTDVARQVKWHGLSLSTNDFKLLFLDALKREQRMVPNIDGNGLVNLGRSSSDLSKAEMADLIELMFAFGANHGVEWSEPKAAEDAA